MKDSLPEIPCNAFFVPSFITQLSSPFLDRGRRRHRGGNDLDFIGRYFSSPTRTPEMRDDIVVHPPLNHQARFDEKVISCMRARTTRLVIYEDRKHRNWQSRTDLHHILFATQSGFYNREGQLVVLRPLPTKYDHPCRETAIRSVRMDNAMCIAKFEGLPFVARAWNL